MDIKMGNMITLDVAVRDSNQALITNLASATAVKYMIKDNATDLDVNALVSKDLGLGIAVNTPSTGYVRIVILPADTSDTTKIKPGQKYHALQVHYSSTNIIEVNLKENGVVTDKVNLIQDVIR